MKYTTGVILVIDVRLAERGVKQTATGEALFIDLNVVFVIQVS